MEGRRRRRSATGGRARREGGEGERENVCIFGDRRGRTGVGIVGLGARGAPTKKYVWGFVWRACECEATERCEGEAMANDGDVDATR